MAQDHSIHLTSHVCVLWGAVYACRHCLPAPGHDSRDKRGSKYLSGVQAESERQMFCYSPREKLQLLCATCPRLSHDR